MTLTDKRRAILTAIGNAAKPLDCHGIALACGKSYWGADWATATVRELLYCGFIEVSGKTRIHSRTYTITPSGLDAITTP